MVSRARQSSLSITIALLATSLAAQPPSPVQWFATPELTERAAERGKAPKTKSGIAIPMQAREVEGVAPRLRFQLAVDPAQDGKATLTIRFGPHELTAPIGMQPKR